MQQAPPTMAPKTGRGVATAGTLRPLALGLLGLSVGALLAGAAAVVLLAPGPPSVRQFDDVADDEAADDAGDDGSSSSSSNKAASVLTAAAQHAAAMGASDGPAAPEHDLRLPGRLPRLHDPRREQARRFEAEQKAAVEAARVEAVAIGDRMAADLEAFVASLRPLSREDQRRYARRVEHHFDWAAADRLALLRQRLPQQERYALQAMIYERVKPLVLQLDAMAAAD
ncbi:MAG: hypothetical protein H6747_06830 [Deltaproteobacteria bacterium]|nr:hypothetical protein [Deltaproteobacteria bacterium]